MPEPGVAAPALETRAVSRRYGRQWAVRRVSVAFPAGTICAVVGHNGSGKSTLLSMLSGGLRPSDGVVLAFGDDLHHHPDLPSVRRRVAWLSHQPPVYPDLTGPENLALAAGLYGRPADAARLTALLDRVGLQGVEHRRVRAYSRGMVQRLGLARVLIQDADVWLLDEPMTGLDRDGRALFLAILAEACAGGRAVVVVTHHVGELEALVDRVYTLERGRLLLDEAAP